ncbi:MAG TPA: type VI secretion system tube protein TssD [Polyangiaceae bacterium]
MRKSFVHVVRGLVVVAGLTVGSAALGATQGYVSIKGQKQGQFKGESMVTSRAAKWMDVLAFRSAVSVPMDAASGGVTGKRKHEPMCFTKHWGAATPQLLNSVVNNELLSEVDFEFVKTDAQGKESVFQTVKLLNAVIVDDRERLGSEAEVPGHTQETFEEVCFAYQRAEITNNDGRTTTVDSW